MPPEPGPSLRPVQRTAAYGVVRDRRGRVLLARASPRSDLTGRWFLPGGGLRHGEQPADALRRELLEEANLRIRPSTVTVRDATADVVELPFRRASVHTLRLLFDVATPRRDQLAQLRPERDGTTDEVRFVSDDEARELPLMPYVADLLGLPPDDRLETGPPVRPEPLTDSLGVPELGAAPFPDARPGEVPVRVQRPAAYAVLTDGDPHHGRILLTRLSGEDLWTLPGGGIDHGEHPLVALEREVHEEAGLFYTAGPLLDIGSRHFTGRAPSGRLEDFHGIRLVYGGSVPLDAEPHVTEVDGSTDAASWFALDDLDRVHTVASVRHALRLVRGGVVRER